MIDRLTRFNMEYDQAVVIPASVSINLPFNILTPDIETNSESTFTVNDTRKDLIEQIYLKQLTLTITSPSSADFSFLKSLSINISAEGLQEIKVGYKENIPDNIGNFLTLDLVDADLQDYIKKDSFTLKLTTVTDQLLVNDYQINVHAVFYVDAKILGQ